MSYNFDIARINMDKPRVRFDGKVLDKCALSWLIHQVAILAGNNTWPLYTDVYWDSFKYVDLKHNLQKWLDSYLQNFKVR